MIIHDTWVLFSDDFHVYFWIFLEWTCRTSLRWYTSQLYSGGAKVSASGTVGWLVFGDSQTVLLHYFNLFHWCWCYFPKVKCSYLILRVFRWRGCLMTKCSSCSSDMCFIVFAAEALFGLVPEERVWVHREQGCFVSHGNKFAIEMSVVYHTKTQHTYNMYVYIYHFYVKHHYFSGCTLCGFSMSSHLRM